jgi:phospholipid/cholesterol/gamma-HCH transport system ATP-binding protein
MSSGDSIIELHNVGVNFGSFQVHRNINFKVAPAEVVTLLGPSGTGKTVILKLIMGLLFANQGKVIVMEDDLGHLKEKELRMKRTQIGMLFQGAALFDSLTVRENIAYPLREAGEKNEKAISSVVSEKLSIVGLPGIEHKFPGQLSGGQKKRVGLARALASTPRIMLFDEPTTGLDPTAIRLIDDLILKLKHEFGITVLTVTHDIESARRISDRWILIDRGEVIADGPSSKLPSTSTRVLDFIEGRWEDR